MATPQVLLWLLLTLSQVATHMMPLLLPAAAASSMVSSSASTSTPCIRKCGDIDIPYPFGIGVNCSWPGMDDGFSVTCNKSFDPPRLYMFRGEVEIFNISVATNEIQIFSILAYRCYDSENTTMPGGFPDSWLNTARTPFLISETQNVFTAIGCYTIAYLIGREDMSYLTGCITTCESSEEAAEEVEACTGLGCCQTAIHANLSFVNVFWGNATNPAWKYSPCNYGFVAQKDWYQFSRRDLNGEGKDSFLERFRETKVPMVLDWAIRNNGSCKVGASGKLTAPACRSNHSECVDAKYGGGYICNCSKGYEGNPYMADGEGGGCTNINECQLPESYQCPSGSKCIDTDGGYECKCKFGRRGKQCAPLIPATAVALLATAVAVVLGFITIVLLQTRYNRKIFSKNGGHVLEKQGITIYTKRELKKITSGYRKRLGGGYFGNVYEGRIIKGNDAKKVAVKRSVDTSVVVAHSWKKWIRRHVPQEGLEENGSFINEIIFQFNARHKNMVQLLGCCLETEIPILVFEFVSNGNLDDALHSARKPCTLSLMERLDIAIGSAEAIAHMHSLGNQQHVHGDIKPSNILLDDGLNPKVSDFGSSKILAADSYYVRTVAGDTGYMDPLYIKTQHFTLECDVYSFGVVLLELITRKKARYQDEGNKLLPVEFVRCFKDEGSGRAMYDIMIEFKGEDSQSQRNMQCLNRIGMLAVRCLKEDKRERPTMEKVVQELKEVKEIFCSEAS